ncbi:hypothetical protein B0H14DRAFT_3538749 [Mycena olivaceomarginata]|nr:hypothetical protein B0H14DRAFT_3538749 [Mycena olivaceomarginata]
MRTAPIAWSSILIVENIRSVEELYERINEHKEELVDVVARRQADVLTTGNLSSTLKRLGFSQNSQSTTSFPRREHRVNITEVGTDADDVEEGERNMEHESGVDPSGLHPEEEPTMRGVYQALAKQQRPPPKGGYPFKKNDHVTTKMGGILLLRARSAEALNIGTKNARIGIDEAELLYHSAYLVLMDGRITDDSF